MQLLTWLLGGVCHQMPDHCFSFQGQPLPLCSRCAGMFVSLCITLALLWRRGRRSGLPPLRVNLVLGAILSAWALDGVNSLVTELMGRTWLYPPHNIARLMTGTGCGLALGVWLYPIAHEALWPTSLDQPATSRLADLIPLLLGSACYVALLLVWRGAPYALWTSIVSAATLFVFVLVNAALIALVWPLRADGPPRLHIAARLACGGALALAEMGSMALLRSWLVG